MKLYEVLDTKNEVVGFVRINDDEILEVTKGSFKYEFASMNRVFEYIQGNRLKLIGTISKEEYTLEKHKMYVNFINKIGSM